jgi:hypothetical protein
VPAQTDGALAHLAEARALQVASPFVGPLADPFPHTGAEPVDLPWDEAADDYVDPLWLRGCLPLLGAGCGQSFVLVVTGADRGRVWCVTPSGAPDLHPTGLDFGSWYLGELERGVARERERVAATAALAQRLDADAGDVEAAIALGRALLFTDRARASALLEGAWARTGGDAATLGLVRAIAELDLLADRHDRIDALADQDPPWGRCYAAIAAARRGDDARAITLFAEGGYPAGLGALFSGYHALALARSGLPRRALEVLREGATSPGNVALAARLQAELGDRQGARRSWARLRPGPVRGERPRPPALADVLGLPRPGRAEVDRALRALGQAPSGGS